MIKYYVVDPGDSSDMLHVVAAQSETEAATYGANPHEMPTWLFQKWRPQVDPKRKGKVAEFFARVEVFPPN